MFLVDSSVVFVDSSMIFLPERFFSTRMGSSRCHSSLSRPASSGIRVLTNDPTMVGDNDEQYNLSMRVGTVEERLDALESTINSMVQEIKKLSLKLDDRSLANGAYRSRRERSLNNLSPSSPPSSINPHPQLLPLNQLPPI